MATFTNKLLGLDTTSGTSRTVTTGDTVTTGGEWTYSENVVISGDLTVNGTTTTINSEIQTADRFILQNAIYTGGGTGVAISSGSVYNVQPVADASAFTISAADTTLPNAGTPGFVLTSDPTGTLAAGDVLLVTGATNSENNGLFEVDSINTTTPGAEEVVIKTAPDSSVIGVVNTTVVDETFTGDLRQTSITVLRADTGGTMSIGSGDATPLTFSAIGTGSGNSLQAAYDVAGTISTSGSNDIAFTLASGNFVVNGGSVDMGDTGTDLTDFGVGTGTFDVNATGAVEIDSTGAGISLDAGAASNFTTSAGRLTLQGAGGATLQADPAQVDAVYINASDAAGGIDIDCGTGGIDITTTGNMATTVASSSTTAWSVDDGSNSYLTVDSVANRTVVGQFLDGGSGIGHGTEYDNNSGASITAGTLVAVDTNTTLQIIEADATSASATNLTCRILGVVADNITNGSTGKVSTVHGIPVLIRFTGAVASSDRGKVAYLDASGQATLTAPSASGDFVVEVGIVQSGNSGAGTAARVHFMPRFVAAVA